MRNPLLDDIEAFLEAHPELTPTQFGLKAVNDGHLVRALRAGRRTWPETDAKARRFMLTYRPKTDA